MLFSVLNTLQTERDERGLQNFGRHYSVKTYIIIFRVRF